MNLLLLGAGGREHALAWKMRHSPRLERLWAMPGSDGMAALAEPLAGDPCDPDAVLAAVEAHAIDLTVVGPEAPLAAGVADRLRAAGRLVFGPSQAAAQLETSKLFAKEFLLRHRIPTARHAAADSPAAARRALAGFSFPVVIKADGLAAGKGVVIAADAAQALAALDAMLSGAMLGGAGQRVLIEEFLPGEELSVLALADGERFLTLAAARDHKRAYDGDRGPNTGGMGAYSTAALLPPSLRAGLEADILQPTIAGMAAAGAPYQGVLYCGLMLTSAGPRVLEFNARFGDPETQAILPRFQGDLVEWLYAAAAGALPPAHAGLWSPEPAACVVAAAAGYPGHFPSGLPISGLPAAAATGAITFHAGTRRAAHDVWLTAGGRVLGVSARALSLPAALARCYQALSLIHFDGIHYRRDIGATAAHDPTLRTGQETLS